MLQFARAVAMPGSARVLSTAVTRRERISFLLEHYADVLAGVRACPFVRRA
jgi:hypothetical protein